MLNPLVKTLTDLILDHKSKAGAALLQAPGDVLGCGWNAIVPGNVYVLGFNPGGQPDENDNSIAQSLESPPNDQAYSIYCCEAWPPNKKHGEHRHQRRVRKYLAHLGEPDACRVASSNILFAKSRQVHMTKHFDHNWFKICWEVHVALMAKVQPRYVLCLGNGEANSAYSRVRAHTPWVRSPSDNHKAPQGSDVVKTFKTTGKALYNVDTPYPVHVIGVRHPSRFGTTQHTLDFLTALSADSRV